MPSIFLRSTLGAAVGALCLSAAAQSAGTLSEVTVTGNPLEASSNITPVDRVQGLDLLLRQQGSLGDTLDHLPGVSSTHFGPTVGRPVIRGLDGDRIRILQSGGASIDASGLSYDHAVPIDPIAIDRVEVLRGPGALLYGGSAIGGVVNVIDSRIPREPIEGITGRADAGVASGNREKSGAMMLQAGNGRQVLHVDAFGRDAQDVRVPQAVPCDTDGTPRLRQRLCNTGAQARGAAVGASTFFERGRIGASVSTFRNDYGSPAEQSVDIGMQSDRYALDGEWRPAAGPMDRVRLQAAHTDYRHTEFEDGEPGTRFANRGNDLRIEARHRPLGPITGVLGLQGEHTRFSADGDEAFAPYSRTRQRALFLHEELATSWGRLSLGLRQESVRVASDGNPQVGRFAIGERSFDPSSYALGALWKLAPEWELSAQAAHSERAPRDYELFANGPHVATAAWERGNAALGLERSNNLDLGLAWKRGADHWRINGFVHRFANYIALQSTGASQEVEPGESLPEYAYRGVPAQLAGWEASGQWRLRTGAPVLDLEWRADRVRGTDRSSGEPLPRLPAMRLGATLVGRMGDWAARLGFDHAARQSRVPTGDVASPAYTLWHAALSRSQRAGEAELIWYARVDNLTDRSARPAASLLTQTAPERAWLAGRSLRLGVRAEF